MRRLECLIALIALSLAAPLGPAASIEHASQTVLLLPAGQDALAPSAETPAAAVPLQAPTPFLAVAAEWRLGSGAETQPVITLHAGDAQGEALAPVRLRQDPHLSEPQTHLFSQLVILPADTERVWLQATHPAAVASIELHFISPGAGQAFDPGLAPEQSGPRQIVAKPPVVTRTQWDNPFGQEPNFVPRYRETTHLIVHHTATSNYGRHHNWAATVRAIWSYHTNTRGWDDIGYNFLIDPNGVIYEGRAGGDDVVGAHFSCANSGTMGVALLGTFSDRAPTDDAQTALVELLAWKCAQKGLNPLARSFHPGTELSLEVISGHRDANRSRAPGACPSGTVCPGAVLYSRLPDIRVQTQRVIDEAVPVDDFELHP
mgnify:CR=1 FL=1